MNYIPSLTLYDMTQAQIDSHPVWGGSLTVEERLRRFFGLMQEVGRSHLHMEGLRDEQGRLVASLKHYRFLMGGGSLRSAVPLFGIGAVFTAPDSRKQGYASTLLRHSLEAGVAAGYAGAILYSDIDPNFYARLGFTPIPSMDWRAKTAALPEAPPLAVRPASAADLPRLMAWYESSWPADTTHIVRQTTTWRQQRQINGQPDELILSDGEHDVGYLMGSPSGAALYWVDEWAAPLSRRAELAPRVWATVKRLAGDAQEVGSWLRPDDRPPVFKATARTKAVPMITWFGEQRAAPEAIYVGSLDHV